MDGLEKITWEWLQSVGTGMGFSPAGTLWPHMAEGMRNRPRIETLNVWFLRIFLPDSYRGREHFMINGYERKRWFTHESLCWLVGKSSYTGVFLETPQFGGYGGRFPQKFPLLAPTG